MSVVGVGVAFRHSGRGVAEQRGDAGDVRATLHAEARREYVSEIPETEVTNRGVAERRPEEQTVVLDRCPQMDAKVRALPIEVIGVQRTEALITVCRRISSVNLWLTDSYPAGFSFTHDTVPRPIGISPSDNGTKFRIVEFPPLDQATEATMPPGLLHALVGDQAPKRAVPSATR